MKRHRRLGGAPFVIALLVVALLVVALLLGACTGGSASDSDPPATTSTVPQTTAEPSSSTTATTPSSTTDPGAGSTTTTLAAKADPEIAAALRDEIAALVVETERIRGLPFLETPEVTVLAPEVFAERVRRLVDEELDPFEVAAEEAFYRMMGLLPAETDYGELLLDLYAEQVAGFYDGETRELVVIGDEKELSPLRKTVVVHELVHALTDQHFAFHDHIVGLDEAGAVDEFAAYQALIEGDATYFQVLYIQELPPIEQFGLAFEALGTDQEVLSRSPRFLREQLEYPYDDGLTFVQTLVADGGIAAVDRAYVEPPVTTEQILHPERHLRGEAPLDVRLGPTLPSRWQITTSGRFGEFQLRSMLAGSVGSGVATQAAAGWGGDDHVIAYDGQDVAFALKYRGDTETDAVELVQALIDHTETTMGLGEGVGEAGGLVYEGAGRYVFIDRVGDEVYYLATTDGPTLDVLRSAIG